MNNNFSHPHDQFFRTVMSNQRVAREFLVAHLPNSILKIIDLENLIFQPRSHIDDVRKESTVDILYKTTIEKKDAYIYLLLEHQSTPDELMPFRILKYCCNVISQHLEKSKTKRIPLVYPIVIYHGKKPYPYSNKISDLVDAPKELVEEYFLKPFHLIDLGIIEDEQLKTHAWAGVMEFALKHIYARDILNHLRNFTGLMRRIDQSGGTDYISIVLQYLFERSKLSAKGAFFDLINKEISTDVGEKIMSLAEQFRQEGKLEGKIEGKIEGKLEGKVEGKMEGQIETQIAIAKRLLAEKVEIQFISRITGLSLNKIRELQHLPIFV